VTHGGAARVVVTGLGCVSACGLGYEALWSSLRAGRPAIQLGHRAFQKLEIAFPVATVPEYDPASHFDKETLLLADPFSQYALLAAREAVADAGLSSPLASPERTAVMLGVGAGGEQTREQASIRMFHEQRQRVLPVLVPRLNHQAAVGLVSADLGVTGPCMAVATGCASSTHAVAQAYFMIRHGLVDRAVAGGSEASILFSTLRAFDALGVLSRDTCRPFSRGRSGMALGEGAGVVILESLESASRRGARIHAELAGAGMSADARHMVHPSVEGPLQAMRSALASAGLEPADIGYINAHGTGTVANDRTESVAIQQLFQGAPRQPPVSSTKSIHGHALGAAGGIELVATILALHHQLLPPTANHLGADPECELDCVPNEARAHAFDAALTNSFAFGGLNAVLAIRRFVEERAS